MTVMSFRRFVTINPPSIVVRTECMAQNHAAPRKRPGEIPLAIPDRNGQDAPFQPTDGGLEFEDPDSLSGEKEFGRQIFASRHPVYFEVRDGAKARRNQASVVVVHPHDHPLQTRIPSRTRKSQRQAGSWLFLIASLWSPA